MKYTEENIMWALDVCMPHEEVCREAYDLIQQKNAQIEHLTAENKRLQNLLNDLTKDEVTT